MCYVHNQWYDISCATLYISLSTGALLKTEDLIFLPLLKVLGFQLPESYEVIHKLGSPIYGSLNFSAELPRPVWIVSTDRVLETCFNTDVYGFVAFLLVSAERIQNNTF